MGTLNAGSAAIEIVQGDITCERVDVIVNAANSELRGGGGVDGAIHRAAGPRLLDACSEIGWCATGDAVITPGFNLRARYVIHAVGPVWKGGGRNEEELLSNCYRRSIELATKYELGSIAFPAISCGVYGYPPELAAQTALTAVTDALANNDACSIEIVRFVLFTEGVLSAFEHACEKVATPND